MGSNAVSVVTDIDDDRLSIPLSLPNALIEEVPRPALRVEPSSTSTQSHLQSPNPSHCMAPSPSSYSDISDTSRLSSAPSSPALRTPRTSIGVAEAGDSDLIATPTTVQATLTNSLYDAPQIRRRGSSTSFVHPHIDSTSPSSPYRLDSQSGTEVVNDVNARAQASLEFTPKSEPAAPTQLQSQQLQESEQRGDEQDVESKPLDLVPSSSLQSLSMRHALSQSSSVSRVDPDTDGATKHKSILHRRDSEVSLIPNSAITLPLTHTDTRSPPQKTASRPRPLRLSSAIPRPIPKSRSWRPALWILAYFFFNMGLTLYNKAILVHFPYPYTMTALHTFCGTIGCIWARRAGYYTPAHLTSRQKFTLALFSILYTLNIAVSNLSLRLVTVPFHQVVRGSAPMFTILVAWLLRSKTRKDGIEGQKTIFGVERRKLISLIPVVAGVGLATYGDYSFTVWGLILTLIGTFLAALKTVLTSILQTAPATSRGLDTPLPSHRSSMSFSEDIFIPKSAAALSSHVAFLDAKRGVGDSLKRSSLSTEVKHDFVAETGAGRLLGRLRSLGRAFRNRTGIHVFFSSTLSPSSPSTSSSARGSNSFLSSSSLPPPSASSPNFFTKRFDLDFGVGDSMSPTTSSQDQDNHGVLQSMRIIKLHPLDLLARMSPLACVQCLLYSVLTGEAGKIYAHGVGGGAGVGWNNGGWGMSLMVLGLNGVIAFMLNVVSLTANQMNGPLTMTVAANVKQVLTILLAMSVFKLPVGLTNSAGITLTLAGGAWYGSLEYQSKRDRMRSTRL
ncbi:UAA transporter [Tulasnella sp. 332]|nr:UAA transporter [Tulasnella sp. 332]